MSMSMKTGTIRVLLGFAVMAFHGNSLFANTERIGGPPNREKETWEDMFSFDGEKPTQSNLLKTIAGPLLRETRQFKKYVAALELLEASPEAHATLLACLKDPVKKRFHVDYVRILKRLGYTRDSYAYAEGILADNSIDLSRRLFLLKGFASNTPLESNVLPLGFNVPREIIINGLCADPTLEGNAPRWAQDIVKAMEENRLYIKDNMGLIRSEALLKEMRDRTAAREVDLSGYRATGK